ncbi:MAG: 2-succinyl-5-enolpyruvyl-6-hydroxy-3-cyclohexene-1-carboxylic-acid synthase [Actinobacteria bacterium]|nr:MAG: 2-succinyl-5-enolpyruvyl-6-hydroxy-3-cyclohexene-1-carboxylic-acid synthase [Actinomycetota bacterium]
MGLGDVSLACAAALVDALAHRGVRHACLSPGSRSTPLALALARDDRIQIHMHLDERSAAFFALGIAKASAAPVALACTSGTAAAEYLPAVVEASQSRTPIVVLTADRPPRLRGTGANQTIDQTDLYGRYARAYLEPPVPATAADAAAWHDTGLRAVAAAGGTPVGPVHVNCPFDEPLVPVGERVSTPLPPAEETGPEARGIEEDAARESLEGFLATHAGRRGVIALGPLPPPRTLSLLSLGALLGWPVLAEPLSGLRLDAGRAGRALAAGQLLIGDPDWLERHRPDVVLQAGAAPTTRATQALVAGSSLVVLDRMHLDPDPERTAERRILADPELFAALAWDAHAEDRPDAPDGWLEAWSRADLLTRAAVDRTLDPWIEPFEGRVARDLAAFLPHGAVLCIGSSSPVRDLDTFMAPRRPPRVWTTRDLLRVLGNRGASGIDGFVSTALGVAVADAGPTYALMGDLTFLHDAGALLWSGADDIDLVLVVLANGGGELFSLLPQRDLPELRDLFVTPHQIDLSALCIAAGVGHERVLRGDDLLAAVQRAARAGGTRVVEVTIDPERGRDRRAEIRAAVARTLSDR